MIIQVPSGAAVQQQLSASPPPAQVVVEAVPADQQGRLDPPSAGEVVLTLPSPETLVRERHEVTRVITRAGPGVEPLVIVIETAEELREDQLEVLIGAAGQSPRPVIVRIIGAA